MSLRISLRDGEKMIVNGAVLRSVGRTDIVVENHAAILRGREIMSPDEATTPARRLYAATMLAYVGDGDLAARQDRIVTLLGELIGAFEAEEAKRACIRFAKRVATADLYRALADCRELIAYEAEALARLETQAA